MSLILNGYREMVVWISSPNSVRLLVSGFWWRGKSTKMFCFCSWM